MKLWTMGIILTFKWDSHGRGELQVSGVYGVEWCIERNPNPGVTTHAWLFFTHQQFAFKQHPDETGAITNLLDGSFDWCCKYIKRETRERQQRDSTSLHFCLHPISASCMSNAATEWVFLWCCSSWFLLPQLQRATSNHSKTCPEGTGQENESSQYRQWPLQTPSVINVKGFQFLICQSFQRSLTYCIPSATTFPSQQSLKRRLKTYY